MKAEIKKRWVEALRSGKYKQTQGRLENREGCCCLGVLCRVVEKECELTISEEGGKFLFNNKGGTLPREVVDYCELTSSNPIIGDFELSVYNDGAYDVPARSFAEIANLIEQNL